ncbi:MAG: ATP-binding protein [Patescibacteria group bacterium]
MDAIAILLGIVFFINLAFAAILTANRAGKNGAGFYSIAALGTSIWVLSEFIFYVLPTDLLATQIAARMLYISGLIFAPFFFFFSFEFLRPSNQKRLHTNFLLFVPAIILLFFILTSDLIIGNAISLANIQSIFIGEWYLAYIFAIAAYFIGGFINLLRQYSLFKIRSIERRQIEIIFLGLIPSIGVGMIFNVIAPYFNDFRFFFLGPLFVVFFIGFTTTAILRYHIFNVKIIATNILVLILWSFLLTRTLLFETSRDLITDGTILLVSIPIGILLVRSVLKEVKVRERVELLAKQLEKANLKLTELDRQKSEFVSIASHQLRSPLTAIKGYSSLILEGAFGIVPEKINEAVDKIYQSSQSLVYVIENFLNISRIEQGRMSYEFVPTDMAVLIKGIVDQLYPNIEKKGLKISFEYENSKIFTANIDQEKLRQSVMNLIDNSSKYTKEGWIKVALTQKAKRLSITISDSGIGMTKQTIQKLFGKFNRGDGAGKINAGGAGLGLFLAAEIVIAHKGKVFADSKGLGKGSTFTIELPVA